MASLASAAPTPVLINYILATAPLLTVALLGYIAKMIRKFLGEHTWLMETTKTHGEQIASNSKEIASNTKAIRRMLDQREKIIEQRNRKRR